VAVLHQVLADTQGLTQVRFVAVPHGLADTRQHRHGPIGHHGLSPALAACDLVVLDELGQQPVTPWASEHLYLLFNELWAQDRPAVVTTDLPAGEFVRRLRPELVSRLLGLCHEVDLTGPPLSETPTRRSPTSTTPSAGAPGRDLSPDRTERPACRAPSSSPGTKLHAGWACC
jgi:DNA replication protein DnaC